MADDKISATELTQLWENPDRHAFAVLDGASIPTLLDKLYGEDGPNFECLYRGDLEPDMAECAPYIAEVERDTDFADWLIGTGWGNHWGIFAVSEAEMKDVRLHFRKLNMVYGPDGRPLLFRYYDPRVLRIFAPTCSGGDLKKLFGPVERFVMEAPEPRQGISLALAGGDLVQQRFLIGRGQ